MATLFVKVNSTDAREPTKDNGVWNFYTAHAIKIQPNSIAFVDTELSICLPKGYRIIFETPGELIGRHLNVLQYNDFGSALSQNFTIAVANLSTQVQALVKHQLLAHFYLVEAPILEIKAAINIDKVPVHDPVQSAIYYRLLEEDDKFLSRIPRLEAEALQFKGTEEFKSAQSPLAALATFLAKRMNADELAILNQ